MSDRGARPDVAERLRPLSKEEIDRSIERVLADLSAAIEAAAAESGQVPGDPLLPRGIPSGALTSRMMKLLGDN